ncbi:hypothetical protein L6164_015250 [Bauhinia variegata]|uniref:Uncharacterized protein n=1 Tax=Bauhinia variegata TaxID=167791 RepID=A0ACB9NKR4_BAUVA|nr:hypothetical protein L6164_015250 [Bauhinia variegata]
MDTNSPPPCPNTVTVRRNPHRKARATPATAPIKYSSYPDLPEISVFPRKEILSAGPENPPLEPPSKHIRESKNIKVFIRIRPILASKGSGKVSVIAGSKAKSAWPQNPAKKNTVAGEKNVERKSSRVCVNVNDSQTVTLSPPIDLQDSKRIKSETYGGFSHVFSSDSSQVEVYERMVKPIVEDFLDGTSGMLAALGPSGSGKTHTVFGCVREPGMVPLALRRILEENQSSRSFYITMFEIYSERGKVEKLFDLLQDGAELSMQQSNVKCLKEVLVSDAGHAESLLAKAMLKRATAVTKTNSQSSRSQCIINIHAIPKKCEGVSAQPNPAVLTIIDLAGAERVKKTRNQGTRLLESNFINNTLVVFGMCLRSLLEHQKNPKKPLQKHFQNSMLTRYLRDYLEGKKRMTLLLTAKPGEEDYLDTSHLLRQASPYMKIKYDDAEPSNVVPNKRQYQSSSTMEHVKPSSMLGNAKRIRLVCCEDSNEEKGAEERHISEEEASKVRESDANNCIPLKSECRSRPGSERNHIIMQNFAKAMLSVLKQYNAKLKVAELEIQKQKQNYLELQKDFNEFKACCTCWKLGNVDNDFQSQLGLDGLRPSNVDEQAFDAQAFDAQASPEKGISVSQCCSILDQSNEEPRFGTFPENSSREVSVSSSKSEDLNALDLEIESHKFTQAFDVQVSPEKDISVSQCCSILDQSDEEPRLGTSPENSSREVLASASKPEDLNASEVEIESHKLNQVSPVKDISVSQCCSILDQSDKEPRLGTSPENSSREVSVSSSKPEDLNALEAEIESHKLTEAFDAQASPDKDISASHYCNILDLSDKEPRLDTSPENSFREVSASSSKLEHPNALEVETEIELLVSSPFPKYEASDPSLPKDAAPPKECDLRDEPKRDHTMATTSSNAERPKRRIMPSSMLLRDLSNLDRADETEKPKGSRGSKKLAAGDLKRTNGSVNLIRLLKSNRHT